MVQLESWGYRSKAVWPTLKHAWEQRSSAQSAKLVHATPTHSYSVQLQPRPRAYSFYITMKKNKCGSYILRRLSNFHCEWWESRIRGLLIVTVVVFIVTYSDHRSKCSLRWRALNQELDTRVDRGKVRIFVLGCGDWKIIALCLIFHGSPQK